MQVDVLETFDALDPLKADWQAVHAQDPHATLFTSWAWLRAWLAERPGRWVVLAAKDEGKACGFFALERVPYKTRVPGLGGVSYKLAGDPDAHLSALLCLRGREDAVTAAFAQRLARLPWRELKLRNVHDPRLLDLLGQLGHKGCRVALRDDRGFSGMALPTSYEAYLEQNFSGARGRKLRAFERKAEAAGLHLAHAEPDTLEATLEALLTLVSERWGKAGFGSEGGRERCRGLLRACYRQGMLHACALWDGERPVAASVSFLDAERGVCHGYLNGWDQDYAAAAPGTLIKVATIRWAIEQGFESFGWGLGSESYKREMGADAPEIHPRAELLKLRPHERLIAALRPARPAATAPRPQEAHA
jgi:CelD/BcsL family acetyltransferase involved in cellulose biosynthesis